MTKKDAQIIADAQMNGTPIFVLTAKDKLSADAITEYMDMCSDEECSKEHIDAVNERITEFLEWQADHPDKVKLPD